MKQNTERREANRSRKQEKKRGENKPLHRNRAAMTEHEIEMKNNGRRNKTRCGGHNCALKHLGKIIRSPKRL